MFPQRCYTLRLSLELDHLRPLAAALHLEHDIAALVAEQGSATPALRHRDDHLADEQGIWMCAGSPVVSNPDRIRSSDMTITACHVIGCARKRTS